MTIRPQRSWTGSWCSRPKERHTRHKHAVREAPVKSLVKLFNHVKKLGVSPTDVDAFAVNWSPKFYPLLHKNVLFV
jgi:hypothetical protein